jgi:hypothetical protein
MSKEEIKSEINRVLDHFSDQTLEDILSLLKKIDSSNTSAMSDQELFEKILSEDKDLLQKLAQ